MEPGTKSAGDPPNARFFLVMERLGLSPHGRRVVDGVETDYYVVSRAGQRLRGSLGPPRRRFVRVLAEDLLDAGHGVAVALLLAAGDFVVAWESVGSGSTDTDGRSIQASGALIFADGFEAGDTSAWQ